MIALRPFARSDWFGFAGAERFDDGSEPLIGELSLATTEAVVVLDAEGLTIASEDETNDGDGWAVCFDGAYAARALAALRNGMTVIELHAMAGARRS